MLISAKRAGKQPYFSFWCAQNIDLCAPVSDIRESFPYFISFFVCSFPSIVPGSFPHDFHVLAWLLLRFPGKTTEWRNQNQFHGVSAHLLLLHWRKLVLLGWSIRLFIPRPRSAIRESREYEERSDEFFTLTSLPRIFESNLLLLILNSIKLLWPRRISAERRNLLQRLHKSGTRFLIYRCTSVSSLFPSHIFELIRNSKDTFWCKYSPIRSCILFSHPPIDSFIVSNLLQHTQISSVGASSFSILALELKGKGREGARSHSLRRFFAEEVSSLPWDPYSRPVQLVIGKTRPFLKHRNFLSSDLYHV